MDQKARTMLVVATDYDGTIATSGSLSAETVAEMQAFRKTGRKILLVTGRQMPSVEKVCPNYAALFDGIVAENGAVLHWPATGENVVLAQGPSVELLEAMRDAGVVPIAVGLSIIATKAVWKDIVDGLIAEHELPLHSILNKDSLMVLPVNIDKGSGLRAALAHFEIDASLVACVGDAENDVALLEAGGFSVAVGNAIAPLKAMADWVTAQNEGRGVVELMQKIRNIGD